MKKEERECVCIAWTLGSLSGIVQLPVLVCLFMLLGRGKGKAMPCFVGMVEEDAKVQNV